MVTFYSEQGWPRLDRACSCQCVTQCPQNTMEYWLAQGHLLVFSLKKKLLWFFFELYILASLHWIGGLNFPCLEMKDGPEIQAAK